MKRMKILVIGKGGREHALVWKFVQEGHLVFCVPGNPGTDKIATNVAIQATDIPKLLKFAQENSIDLTVVGPEEPLFLGIVDIFAAHGLRIFGPRSAAARIEKSKAFARDVMLHTHISQPQHAIVDDYEKALAYVRERDCPCFVKADGPAGGKGAIPCQTLAEAEAALHMLMIEKAQGNSGRIVVIEEWLDGDELSAHALCDGQDALLFPFSRDHKRALDENKGENTGGMGTVVPASRDDNLYSTAKNQIVQGILEELRRQGTPYKGLLYPGLMVTKKGLKVLEFNARFGDPETQVYVRHLVSPSLGELLVSTLDGTLTKQKPVWRKGFSVCIVLTSGWYPGKDTGEHFSIEGVEYAEQVPGVVVFHAGTSTKNGRLVTNGGRVLNVTCHAETLELALKRAYIAVGRIHFEGKKFRKDIGRSLLASK